VGSNTSDQPAGSAHCSQRYERNQQRREKRKRIEAGEGLLSLAKSVEDDVMGPQAKSCQTDMQLAGFVHKEE
jgi:hypothetical protein